MRTAKRTVSAMAVIGLVTAMASGCSNASAPPDPAQWRQVDAAENVIYRILTSPTTMVQTPEALFHRLSTAVIHWNENEEPPGLSADNGTAVFYDYQENIANKEAAFSVFVASGLSDHPPGWFESRPTRIYTCYRLEVSFENDELSNFRRSRDHDEELLSCPAKLVSALGDGASYREPWIFDG